MKKVSSPTNAYGNIHFRKKQGKKLKQTHVIAQKICKIHASNNTNSKTQVRQIPHSYNVRISSDTQIKNTCVQCLDSLTPKDTGD